MHAKVFIGMYESILHNVIQQYSLPIKERVVAQEYNFLLVSLNEHEHFQGQYFTSQIAISFPAYADQYQVVNRHGHTTLGKLLKNNEPRGSLQQAGLQSCSHTYISKYLYIYKQSSTKYLLTSYLTLSYFNKLFLSIWIIPVFVWMIFHCQLPKRFLYFTICCSALYSKDAVVVFRSSNSNHKQTDANKSQYSQQLPRTHSGKRTQYQNKVKMNYLRFTLIIPLQVTSIYILGPTIRI